MSSTGGGGANTAGLWSHSPRVFPVRRSCGSIAQDWCQAGLDPAIAPSVLAIESGDRYPGWSGILFAGGWSRADVSRISLAGDDGGV